MEMSITKPAAKWFIKELELAEGDSIRFFARYGGFGGVHKGFSLALEKAEPNNLGAEVTEEGIHFFVEESDIWYFDQKNLHIKYSRKYDEIEYVVE
ncbi:HesB/YadR/YfhF family protein [Gracilibacillus caseinilyticus]|uniref:HesB/YadR/YfhF family protein n=2 Tax=Gracilibacillus caseinilyticus TaxID=2932256 RepID=A0ABY4F1I1_9BACI|nr:HesB/YadR/YfhF family protein [Gracilibacillus caseinilyticus]UOQ50542.1 HesB/YadR/YfhF family protein [Gracilibacillus caseinilyticus]